MIVRCGRCGAGFDVPGPGRHVCPTCGTVNEVKVAGSPAAPATPPSPLPPDVPSPKVTCPQCGFTFIVGQVTIAPCPNCGNPVTVTATSEEEA